MKLLRKLFQLLVTQPKFKSSQSAVVIEPRVIQYLIKLKRELVEGSSESNRQGFLLKISSLNDRRDQILHNLKDLDSQTEDKSDPEMLELVASLRQDTLAQLHEIEGKILSSLVPPSPQDSSGVVLEVSSGVGGLEAMLFTREIFGLYQNYSKLRNWNFELVDYKEESGLGGLRTATASITGKDVYKRLKFEGGVHRVQRVPATESSGRIHTSTMSVAILPQPVDISVVLRPADIRVETKRSSSKGGQHANKTESAVRLVHLPTGLAVENQTDRSQVINKRLAMQRLAAILYERQLRSESQKESQQRKLQVGDKDRSEKIRTYNFPQDRITDHRVKLTFTGVTQVLSGENFDEIVDSLLDFHQAERLEEILNKEVPN